MGFNQDDTTGTTQDDLSHLNVTEKTDPKIRKTVEKAAHEEGVDVPKTVSLLGDRNEERVLIPVETDWAKVPVDGYWFTKSWGRSPNPTEQRVWEFELVTMDANNQQSRMFAKVDGPFEEALDKARVRWDAAMAAEKVAMQGVRARKIIVLSS